MTHSGWATGVLPAFVICFCIAAASDAFDGPVRAGLAAAILTGAGTGLMIWRRSGRARPSPPPPRLLDWAPPPPPPRPQRQTTVYRERVDARPWGFCLAVGDPYAIAALEAYAAAAAAAGDSTAAVAARAMAAQWAARPQGPS